MQLITTGQFLQDRFEHTFSLICVHMLSATEMCKESNGPHQACEDGDISRSCTLRWCHAKCTSHRVILPSISPSPAKPMSTEGSATLNAFAFQSANCSVSSRATAMTI